MPFDLETIAKSLTSPPGQIAAGMVLGGIVWTWFKRVGDVLNDSTNKEIARWIKVKNVEAAIVAGEAENWPGTFAKVFDRVFGEKHWSWKCFRRSCAATVAACVLCSLLTFNLYWAGYVAVWEVLSTAVTAAVSLLLFDYLSLLESRYFLELMSRRRHTLATVSLLAVDAVLTGVIGSLPVLVARATLTEQHQTVAEMNRLQASIDENMDKLRDRQVTEPDTRRQVDRIRHLPRFDSYQIKTFQQRLEREKVKALFVLWLPTFFTSIWLWLYAASGFLLKATRRFDVTFQWLHKRLDLEKRPLQSLGVVSGVLVMLVWWGFALVAHLIK